MRLLTNNRVIDSWLVRAGSHQIIKKLETWCSYFVTVTTQNREPSMAHVATYIYWAIVALWLTVSLD
jgi:hypothetical protein